MIKFIRGWNQGPGWKQGYTCGDVPVEGVEDAVDGWSLDVPEDVCMALPSSEEEVRLDMLEALARGIARAMEADDD